MSPEAFRSMLENLDLNPKLAATILHVTPTSIYRWLKGTRPVPRFVVDLLTLRLHKPKMVLSGRSWRVQ